MPLNPLPSTELDKNRSELLFAKFGSIENEIIVACCIELEQKKDKELIYTSCQFQHKD